LTFAFVTNKMNGDTYSAYAKFFVSFPKTIFCWHCLVRAGAILTLLKLNLRE